MRRALQLGLVVAFALAFAPAFGQLTEEFCTGPAVPDGKCSGDNLSIIFDATDTNELNLPAFVAGTRIPCKVYMDTVSMMVQGWSYSIVSDAADVTIVDADITFDGTDARAVMDANPGSPGQPPTPFLTTKVVDGGMFSAVVMDLFGGAVLEVKRNSILALTYTLVRDVGTDGTLLRIASGEIGAEGSPSVEINISARNASLSPMLLTHGQITIGPGVCVPTPGQENAETSCADGVDNDCDDLIDGDDPDCAPPPPEGCPDGTAANGLYFGAVGGDEHMAPGGSVAIVSRNDADLLGFSFGVQTPIAGGAQTWNFADSGVLGNLDPNGDPVFGGSDLNFTKTDGSFVLPAKGNTASVASADPINGVELGSALTAISGDEFFVAEIDPDIGGPGFFVGYVASFGGNINIVIPATPDVVDMCPSNELVIVTVGVITDVAFKRGDANGNGKIAVTDGVLIIQNAVGNRLPTTVDCNAALDANGDGANDLSDGVFILNYIFKKTSPVPPAPFRACEMLAGADCAVSTCP